MVGFAAARKSGVARAPVPVALDLPSATTLRFVLLAVAMLAAGLFIGVSVFGAVDGRAFAAAGDACYGAGAAAGVAPVSSSTAEAAATACLAPFERLYALYAVGGAVVVLAGAVMVILVAPLVMIRRRRLRDPGPAGAPALARLAGFCADAGIRRPPRLLVGSALRDPFSLGHPGRYAVAVPQTLMTRWHTPLFEAALRHELAHIRSDDVALAWLARAVWYSLAPLLLVPVVLFVRTGDEAILPDYLWRAAVIGVVVSLAARSALRSRELSADVSAARLAGTSVMIEALARARSGSSTPWRRLCAVHPGSEERILAVREPGRTAVVTITDGLVVGLLIGFTFPMLDLFFTAVLFGTAGVGLSLDTATALLLGPLAGAMLGLGFWRQAAVDRTDPPWRVVAPVLAGVATGAVVGQLASPGGIGLSGLGGLDHPALILVVALALAGAAGLTAGCSAVLADVVHRRSAMSATAAAMAVCTAAIWAGDHAEGLLDQGGRASLGSDVLTDVTPVLAVVSCVLAGALVVCGLIVRRAVLRRLQVPPAKQIYLTGAAAGLAAVAITVVNGLWLGHVGDPGATAQTVLDSSWIAAAAAAAAAAVLALANGQPGWGAGLIAGPVAALVAATGTVGLLAVVGVTIPSVATTTGIAADDLGLGFAMTLLVAAVLPASGTTKRTRSSVLVTTSAALLAAVVGLATAVVLHIQTTEGSASPAHRDSATRPTVTQPTTAPSLTDADYKIIAVILADQHDRIQIEMNALAAQPTLTRDQVVRIDGQLIPDLQRLLDQAVAITPAEPTTAALHRRLIDSLQLTIVGYREVAVGMTDDDAASLTSGRTELTAAMQEFASWSDLVRQL